MSVAKLTRTWRDSFTLRDRYSFPASFDTFPLSGSSKKRSRRFLFTWILCEPKDYKISVWSEILHIGIDTSVLTLYQHDSLCLYGAIIKYFILNIASHDSLTFEGNDRYFFRLNQRLHVHGNTRGDIVNLFGTPGWI